MTDTDVADSGIGADDAVRSSRRSRRGDDPKAASQRVLPGWLANLPGDGPPGPNPGRIGWPIHIPRHFESTAALQGLYPWLAGVGIPQLGPLLGRDRFSRGRFCFDPWALYQRGILQDQGIIVAGAIGSAKTSCVKSIALRSAAFGHGLAVPADTRAEWVGVAEALGGRVMRLGPGMPDRLNALAMPPKPPGVDEQTWWLTVRTHWEELLEALARTLLPGQRELRPVESTAIETALTSATRWDETSSVSRLQPLSIGRLVDQLRDPSDLMVEVIGMPRDTLTEALRDLYLTLRRMTAGSMQGLVDDDRPDNQINPHDPATVVDISRVQASDAAVGLVMACTQSVIELAAAHRIVQWWVVYDEAWRLMRFPALIKRINAGQRLARKTGAATALITHRLSDLELGGTEARSYATDLLGDCSTRILYRQRADAITATMSMLDLTDIQAQLLPTLNQGTALWQLGNDHNLIIDHLVPRGGTEWNLVTSDTAMQDDYRTHAGATDKDLGLTAA